MPPARPRPHPQWRYPLAYPATACDTGTPRRTVMPVAASAPSPVPGGADTTPEKVTEERGALGGWRSHFVLVPHVVVT